MGTELQRARSRQMLLFLFVCAGMLILLGRLYYWQAIQGSHLADLANAEHIQNQIVNAPRGLIYDAQGHLLAGNVVRDDVYIEPLQFWSDHLDNTQAQSDLSLLVSQLHSVLPALSVDKLSTDFKLELQTYRIAASISPDQSKRLRDLHLSYTFLEPHPVRIYPEGALVAQILGYVSADNKGFYGIEGKYDALLAGKPGNFTAETDLNGNPLTVGASSGEPAVSGASLTLTIDSTIQYLVQTALTNEVKRLAAQSGTVLVVNAHTGAIVAMAGTPTFDPNSYGDYATKLGCLGTESVYLNPALYCAYEPGSTMKAVTMAAALDQGLITPDTTITDNGTVAFKDAAPVANWEYLAYGTETMTEVLIHSANVGAAIVAHDILGADHYYPYLARFGFGRTTGIDGPEQAGFYRTPASPDWTPTDLTRQAFGQSILATPLQVAMAYQAIANGGVLMRPYLVASIDDNSHVSPAQPQVANRVISSSAAQLLTGMLVHAADEGFAQTAIVPGYSVAAKTGTATTQGIATDETEASVAGFLPASRPQFVILVKLDRPQATIYGSTAAGPLWGFIAQQLMWHYHIPPDRSS
ncbi:MAG TPA: penicillin-binding protein 2 [Ktedonobacteraceae bacterium]|nr:penicillin-binding protein 2 [Ktedonobacteraceae bacterium]